MELVEVDVTRYAFHPSSAAVLPQGETDFGITLIFGHEDVVFGVTLACKVLAVDLLAGVYHGLGSIFLLHQFEQFVHTGHVQSAAVVAFDVEHGDEVLRFLVDKRLEIVELLISRGFAAVDVVTTHK